MCYQASCNKGFLQAYGVSAKHVKIERPIYVALNSSRRIDFSVLQIQKQKITWVFFVTSAGYAQRVGHLQD